MRESLPACPACFDLEGPFRTGLGNWTSKDGKTKLKVVRLDESNYIVACDRDLYCVYHSEVAGSPLVSVRDLSADKPRYAYWTRELSDDGTLGLRNVSDKVVPDDTKDSAGVRQLLQKNLTNPALFGDAIRMIKDK